MSSTEEKTVDEKARKFKEGINLEASRRQRENVSLQIRKDSQLEALSTKRKSNHNNNNNDGNKFSNESNVNLIISMTDKQAMEWHKHICDSVNELCKKIAEASNMISRFTVDPSSEKTEFMLAAGNTFDKLDEIIAEGGQTAEDQFMKNNVMSCVAAFLFFPMPSFSLIMSVLGLVQDLTAGDMGEVADFVRFPVLGYLAGLIKIDHQKLHSYDEAKLDCYMKMSACIMHIFANIAFESYDCREKVLNENVLDITTNSVMNSKATTQEALCAYTRLINCMLRIKPLSSIDVVRGIVVVFGMLYNIEDRQVQAYMLDSYYKIMSSRERDYQMLLINNESFQPIAKRLFDIVQNPQNFAESDQCYAFRKTAMNTLLEILYCDELCIKSLVEWGIVDLAAAFVDHSLVGTVCMALSILSEVAATDPERSELILSRGILTDAVLRTMKHLDHYEVRKHLIKLVRNIVCCVSDAVVLKVFESKIVCLKVCEGLITKNIDINKTSIGLIRVALQCGHNNDNNNNNVRAEFEKHKIYSKLVECEQSENETVSTDATEIIELYFSAERQEEKDTLTIVNNDNGQGVAATSEFRFEPPADTPQEGKIFGQTPTEAMSTIFGGIAKMINEKFQDDSKNTDDMKY